MSYAEKLLAEDEKVVLDLRQHWKALIVPVLVFLVVCGVVGVLFGLVDNGTARWIFLGLGLAAIVWFTLRPFLVWYFTHFIVTDRRVMMRSGVIARKGRDVPLSRINDTNFEHSVIERILRCGSLVISSAGEQGQVTLRDVPGVQSVQRRINELVEDTDARLSGRRREDRPGGWVDEDDPPRP